MGRMAGPGVIGTPVVTIVEMNTVVKDWAEQLGAQRKWAEDAVGEILNALKKEQATRADSTSAMEARMKDAEESLVLMKMATVPNSLFKARLDACAKGLEEANAAIGKLGPGVSEDDPTQKYPFSPRGEGASADDATPRGEQVRQAVRNEVLAGGQGEGVAEQQAAPDESGAMLASRVSGFVERSRRTEQGVAELAERLSLLTEQTEALEQRLQAELAELKGPALASLRKDLELEQEARENALRQMQEARDELTEQLTAGLERVRVDLREEVEAAKASQAEILDRALAELQEELRRANAKTEEVREEVGDCRKSMVMHLAEDTRRIQGEIDAKASTDALLRQAEAFATQLAGVRDSIREEACAIRGDLAEARAASVTSAVQNEQNTKAVAQAVAAIQGLMDELRIKEAASLVWEWEQGHVPKTEEDVKRLRDGLRASGHVLDEVQRETRAFRSHFKMFHQIASCLDDVPVSTSVPSTFEGG